MLVYRVANKNEIDILLNEKSFDNIGKHFTINDLQSTHQYKNDKKYIHFFKDRDSIYYCIDSNNCFICTYDISVDILNKSEGFGLYLDLEFLRYKYKVIEYAVDTDLMSFDYLKRIDKLINTDNIDECFYNDYKEELLNIYSSDNLEMKLKKD